jgi:hypothetical protein
MKPLTPEQVDWIALSLVNTGEVTKHHQTYFKSGHPLPAWLLPDLLFDALVADGLLALTPSNDTGLARVALTDTGRAHYAQLRHVHQGTSCLPPVLTGRSTRRRPSTAREMTRG